MFYSSTRKSNLISNLLIWIGRFLILSGIFVIFYSFGPLLLSEVRYVARNQPIESVEKLSESILPKISQEPVNKTFGIVIPKIQANAPIIADVNPFDSFEYQYKLAQGVAHAAGSGLPNDDKTMFLFAHASGDVTMARRYNSVFYLLRKLEKNDLISVYYEDNKYDYEVTSIKEVSPDKVSYLEDRDDADIIVMTCTPAGTTWKRLLVFGVLKN